MLSGHKNAVLEVKWASNGTNIISCSADKTVCYWDGNKGKRIRKFTDHSKIVNCCSIGKESTDLFVSGSDDCSVILWDARSKRAVQAIPHDYQITSVCMSHDSNFVYSGGIDNCIRYSLQLNIVIEFNNCIIFSLCRKWDLRKYQTNMLPDLTLKGHLDTITGLALSPDGSYILSNAMDSSLR